MDELVLMHDLLDGELAQAVIIDLGPMRSSKSLLRSLRAKDGPAAFYGIEFLRSDSGFCGLTGNALLSPIGILNSPVAMSALHSVHVFSISV